MKRLVRRVSILFAAGTFGGVINSLAVWLFGLYGLSAWLGVSLAPQLSPDWLYPRLVWGGVWAVLFFIPLKGRNTITKGLLLSLGPSLVQLFYIFPVQAGQGIAGIGLGWTTPLLVLFFNGLWGAAAGLWLIMARESATPP